MGDRGGGELLAPPPPPPPLGAGYSHRKTSTPQQNPETENVLSRVVCKDLETKGKTRKLEKDFFSDIGKGTP